MDELRLCCPHTWPYLKKPCEAFGAPSVHGCKLEQAITVFTSALVDHDSTHSRRPDMAERVCIPNADQSRPRFHKLGEWHPAQFGGPIQTTACGVAEVHPTFGIDSIRRDRAELFAYPCKRCFKDGAE